MHTPPIFLALDFDGVLHHHFSGINKGDIFDPVAGVQSFKDRLEARFPRQVSLVEPWGNADGLLFDREHHLEELLRKFPTIEIVLATSWCRAIPLAHLPKFLSATVRDRVVGELDHSQADETTDGARGKLMTRWLEQRGHADPIWFALDDQRRHYTLHLDHLVKTHWRGMDSSTVTDSVSKIAQLTQCKICLEFA